jgi:hypothetical protein
MWIVGKGEGEETNTGLVEAWGFSRSISIIMQAF